MPEPDDTILTLMNDLAACLCAELAAMAGEDEPPTCICGPIPGAFPLQAYLGEGEDGAWVRLVDAFGSNTPGQQLLLPHAQIAGETQMIEMGVLRCYTPKKDYSESDLQQMHVIQIRDKGAMTRAIECCAGRSWDDNQFVVGNYVPVGPEGDLFGARIVLGIQIEI